MSQVFSWLCEISADSSSCFLLYFLQIASVHDFWMEENLLKRFYKLLNWSCSTLIEHFRCTFTWENHLLLCHLNPQGPLIEEKCEENWAPLLIIIFVMVSFEVYLNFEMSDWLITVMIMLMKNASDFSLEKVMIPHQIFRVFLNIHSFQIFDEEM